MRRRLRSPSLHVLCEKIEVENFSLPERVVRCKFSHTDPYVVRDFRRDRRILRKNLRLTSWPSTRPLSRQDQKALVSVAFHKLRDAQRSHSTQVPLFSS